MPTHAASGQHGRATIITLSLPQLLGHSICASVRVPIAVARRGFIAWVNEWVAVTTDRHGAPLAGFTGQQRWADELAARKRSYFLLPRLKFRHRTESGARDKAAVTTGVMFVGVPQQFWSGPPGLLQLGSAGHQSARCCCHSESWHSKG